MKFKGKAFKNSILVMFISEMFMIQRFLGFRGSKFRGLGLGL